MIREGGNAMKRRTLLTTAALVPAARAMAAQAVPPEATLDATLIPYLGRYGLPALAAAVVQSGHVIAAGAVGTRRADTETPVTLDDRFHIGSDTKAMTALLAAMLIEAGALHWDSTVAAVFPELAGTMDAGLRRVTLKQLLSHSGGIPGDNQAFSDLIGKSFVQEGLNLDGLRYWLVRQWSTQPLAAEPGGRFAYANWAMCSRVRCWSALRDRSGGDGRRPHFCAVRLPHRRFRPAGEPRPRRCAARPPYPSRRTLMPMLAGPDGDNPVILGPAGTVHLSILEFAAWAGWNAGEGRRAPALVRPESVRFLHTQVIAIPPLPGAAPGTPSGGGGYALGWGIARLPYSTEPFVTHAGSNGMNLATVAMQPAHDFALVIATNVGGTKADDALRALTQALYERFGPAR